MENQIEIYQSRDGQTQIEVTFEQDTVWLNRNQLAELFGRDVKTIGKHINNVFNGGELDKGSVVANFAITAADGKTYQVDHYNLDVIISVGYRVNSTKATLFRQWATQRLKDYLVQGYAINEKRLAQKQQEVQTLKDGIRILNRAIEGKIGETIKQDQNIEVLFSYLSKFIEKEESQEKKLDTRSERIIDSLVEYHTQTKDD